MLRQQAIEQAGSKERFLVLAWIEVSKEELEEEEGGWELGGMRRV